MGFCVLFALPFLRFAQYIYERELKIILMAAFCLSVDVETDIADEDIGLGTLLETLNCLFEASSTYTNDECLFSMIMPFLCKCRRPKLF